MKASYKKRVKKITANRESYTSTPKVDKRRDGEGVARGVTGENQPCYDRVEEEDIIYSGNHKRKQRESV